ncbi:infB, partial [Symbiodinium sp. KB8]
AEDFLFALDLLNSLDAFRLRCLDELNLRDAGSTAGDSKQFCLQRIFGITLGAAAATWGSTQQGPEGERQESRLLSLGPVAGPCLTFRWKDTPALGAADESRQPIEGCIRTVRLLLDIDAVNTVVETVKKVVQPFTEILEPPPFASSWCRVLLHDLSIDLAPVQEFPFPSKLKLPSLLLTSLSGLGELFTALETLPSRHVWSGRHCEGRGARSEPQQGEPAADRSFGSMHMGIPARGTQRPGAWAARQAHNGDYVPVDYDELVEMFRAHISARALETVLDAAQRELVEEKAGAGIDAAAVVLSQSPTASSPRKKSGRRGWLSGLKHSFKDAGKSSKSKSEGLSRQEARLREAAAELASLQEAVRRLQHQRREAALRKEALQRAVEEELQHIKASASAIEEDLTMQIALEKGKQAELSAKADEQRQQLMQLLCEAHAKALDDPV